MSNGIYNVTIRFEKMSRHKKDWEVVEEFPSANDVDVVTNGMFDVSLTVVADSFADAYHVAANLVTARIGVSAVGPIDIHRGYVTSEDGEEEEY